MKRIEVNGTKRDIAIVRIPRWMTHKEVIEFLKEMGLEAGTDEDLRACHAQYPEVLERQITTALGSHHDNGKSLAFDAFFAEKGKEHFREMNTEQDYLRGHSFIGIFQNNRMEDPLEQYQPAIIEKKGFQIDGTTRTAMIIPFSRWGNSWEINTLLSEKGCGLQVGSLEEVKAYFAQHPEDLERKWESKGKERPYAFLQERDFEDFFTSESATKAPRGWWCGTLVVLRSE